MMLVLLKRNLFFPRFAVDEKSVESVPLDAAGLVFEYTDFWGTTRVYFTNQTDFDYVQMRGGIPEQFVIQGYLSASGILLMLAEYVVCYGIQKVFSKKK